MSQITFDGIEVPVVNPPRRQPKLTGVQAEILRRLRDQGSIRSVEAGEIVHRGDDQWSRQYWSTDGSEALKRLKKRGLVQRDPDKRGRWLPT